MRHPGGSPLDGITWTGTLQGVPCRGSPGMALTLGSYRSPLDGVPSTVALGVHALEMVSWNPLESA
jgi:hypothetical protein